jgi:gamma-glutamylcysteine synthetase
MRPSNATSETIAHQDRRTSIWNSLYAAVLGVVPHPSDEHPGYADVILTRAHRTDTSYAPATVAYLDAIHGVRSC